MSDAKRVNFLEFNNLSVTREEELVVICTPMPGPNGEISKKTPVYHLPVYNVELKLDDGPSEEVVSFQCDLADLTDLIDRLKACENLYKRQEIRKKSKSEKIREIVNSYIVK